MRTLPAVEFDIPVQPGWTWLVDGLCLLAVATLVAWWIAAGSAPAEPLRSAFFVIGVLVVLLAWSARRGRPCRLRWDGRQWFCARAARGVDLPPVAGRLGVMLDFQSAMLLRFEPDGHHDRALPRWISVHRLIPGADWHVFRCAVFSQQRAGGDPAHQEAKQ